MRCRQSLSIPMGLLILQDLLALDSVADSEIFARLTEDFRSAKGHCIPLITSVLVFSCLDSCLFSINPKSKPLLCSTQKDKQAVWKRSNQEVEKEETKSRASFSAQYLSFGCLCTGATELIPMAIKEHSHVKVKTKHFSSMNPQGLKSLISASQNEVVFRH